MLGEFKAEHFRFISALDEIDTELKDLSRSLRLSRTPKTLAEAVSREREFGWEYGVTIGSDLPWPEADRKRARVERLKYIARDFRVPYGTVKQLVDAG